MIVRLFTPARNFVPDYWRIRHPSCRLQYIDFCHHIWQNTFGTPASKSKRSKDVNVGRIIILGDSDDQISYLRERYTRHFQIFCARVRRYSYLNDCLSPSSQSAESLILLTLRLTSLTSSSLKKIDYCSVYLIVCHVTSFTISSSFMSISISSMMRTLSAFIAVSQGRLVLQSVLIIIIISWLRLM